MLALAALLFFLWGCSSDRQGGAPDFSAIEVRYEVIANGWQGKPQYKAAFTLVNHGPAMLPDTGWSLWFNQGYRQLVADSTTGGVRIERPSGDWYRLSPKEGFRLPPDSSVVVTMVGSWSITKVSDAPCGLYFTFGESRIPVRQYQVAPFTRSEQIHRIPGDRVPIPTAALDFEQNSRLSLLAPDEVTPVLPTPVSLQRGEGEVSLEADGLEVHYQPSLAREADLLAGRLEALTGQRPRLVEGGNGGAGKILLAISPLQVAGKAREAYRLSANEVSGIEILGSDAAGVFYGCQTLLQLLPLDAWAAPMETLRVPAVLIEDAPRFGWRGMHLDASRNFHQKESVLRLLDLMAFYKLNRLHFHLTNDEGWRLEIPGLPELTEVGGRRGHTLDERDHLHPSYGSGPEADAPDNHGTGHYTRADFIEILRYAADRHIAVVPEIVVPGHARAAIKAMEARFRKYMEQGDEAAARQYLLSEAGDTSQYLSVQGYDDNVVNVCLESTYAFLDKVVAELQQMYADAGLELHLVHTGGDEVPDGTWAGSPTCADLLAARDELQRPYDLTYHFRRRLRDLLHARGLQMAGWEEVGMLITDQGVAPNPEFVPDSMVLFIWNSLWGQQDLGYRLANAGYPVVLCNVTNLYFDLAYDKDPDEPGLYWGGYVNTQR
ncbi:MAG: beta-N-acetylhexosaminidase, partial [Bacteroidetes bacterium]